jgi:hypothetical protein
MSKHVSIQLTLWRVFPILENKREAPALKVNEMCHELTLPQDTMQISVMRAWIAGIQIRRMRPETSMSTLIPALHAGMTQWLCLN